MSFVAIGAFVGTYGVAIAGAVAAAGAVYAGEKSAQAQEYNAKVMDQNAEVARSQAASQEDDQRQKGRAMIGRQLAATSESGGDLSGSNLDLLNTSLYGLALDSANIRYVGEVKASGASAQAILDRQQAGATRTGSYLTAAGKLVGASSSYLNSGGTVPTAGWDLSHTTRGSGD